MGDGGYGPARAAPAGARASPYPPDDRQEACEPGGLSEGELCQFFLKAGWCKFADGCRYAHVFEPKEPEVCQFFERAGWCKFGDQCRHLHVGAGADGLRPEGGQDLIRELLGEDAASKASPGTEVCQFFAKAGWCKFSDNCRYAHVGGPATPAARPAPAAVAGLPEAGAAGEVCQFFARSGWCKWGDGCKFVHAGGPQAPQQAAPQPARGEAQLCEFFLKAGWCKWGDQCKHVHAVATAAVAAFADALPAAQAAAQPVAQPLRVAGGVGAAARPVERVLLTGTTAVCKYFNSLTGCRNGAMCTFAHDVNAPTEVCQFFQKSGWCKFGDQCKYAHVGGAPGGAPGGPLGGPQAGPQAGQPIAHPDWLPVKAAALKALTPQPAPGSAGEICQFFAKAGWCKWADACKYLHEGGPSGASPAPRPEPVLTEGGQEVCQFFAKAGWCKFSDQCRYAHVLLADPAAPAFGLLGTSGVADGAAS